MQITLIIDQPNPAFANPVKVRYQQSITSVQQHLCDALTALGHHCTTLTISPNLEQELLRTSPDFVFNRSNLESTLPGKALAPLVLEKHRIPYSGPNAENCIITSDKSLSKKVLLKSGVATSRWTIIDSVEQISIPQSLAFPLFIKPARGGSSMGIDKDSLVENLPACKDVCMKLLHQLNQPLLVEEFLPGREFTVGVLGNTNPCIFPILEFIHPASSQPAYRSFASKMITYHQEEKCCPAALSAQLEEQIRQFALQAFSTTGCRDYARVDIRLDSHGIPNVLEINAFPEMIPEESSYPFMAKAGGLDYVPLIERILQETLQRQA